MHFALFSDRAFALIKHQISHDGSFELGPFSDFSPYHRTIPHWHDLCLQNTC